MSECISLRRAAAIAVLKNPGAHTDAIRTHMIELRPGTSEKLCLTTLTDLARQGQLIRCSMGYGKTFWMPGPRLDWVAAGRSLKSRREPDPDLFDDLADDDGAGWEPRRVHRAVGEWEMDHPPGLLLVRSIFDRARL